MGVIVWGYMAIVCVSLSRSRGLRSLFCEWKRWQWPHMSCKEEHSDEQLSEKSSGISSNNNNLFACIFSQALKRRWGKSGTPTTLILRMLLVRKFWYKNWNWCYSVAFLPRVTVWFRCLLLLDYTSALPHARQLHSARFKHEHPYVHGWGPSSET